ncbi:MAG: TAT-variant-translocated molybdopterin oxidoreductase, partial [Fulvivirga sp.]|nr:TAT-variant-translocated molybdopterin oxidoreductase [Fulvivirga sp.]
MKDNKKIYWKGVEQLSNDPEFVKHADKEFPEYLPLNQNGEESGGSSRRDFLKMMGFGIAAASLAACEAPVRKAIPYVNKPVDVDPGIPNYYASTYASGGDYCSIVVKTREGRPIKIEGNNLSSISQGGVNAQIEASVLTLYDNSRLRGPKKGGNDTTWETVDKEVINKLNSIAAQGSQIAIVSNTILSPATKQVIADFKAKYPTTKHVMYDTSSAEGILSANESSFGKRAIPSYDFSKAEIIVGIGADFLGTWLSPVEYTKQYSKTRKLEGNQNMSRHYQFESNLSLTGSNADYRTPIKPSDEGKVVAALYNAIAGKTGNATLSVKGSFEYLDQAAADLLKTRGKSIVVSGSNDPAVQTLVNAINEMLGNYGKTVDLDVPVYYRQGNEKAMSQLLSDAKAGRVGGMIFMDCNPVYNHPKGATLKSALEKISLTISTSEKMDETASAVEYVAPEPHYLEAWNDANPKKGVYSLGQPTITPIFNTRQAQESLLTWAGKSESFYDYLRNYWRKNILTGTSNFQDAWDKTLQDGVLIKKSDTLSDLVASNGAEDSDQAAGGFAGDVNQAAAAIAKNYKGSDLELAIYQKVGIGDGSQANNPWLQEMPDPITKATWDNYLTVSQAFANEKGIKTVEGKTNKVKLTVGDRTVELPVVIQPGQAKGTVGLAVGYGRTQAGKVADGRGVDAYPFVSTLNGTISYNVLSGVSVEVLDEMYQVAQTQTHQTYMGRDTVIQDATLKEYQENP